MTPQEAALTQQQQMLAQQQAAIRQEKRQVMANAFVQPQQRFADIQTQAPNLKSGLLADDAYATAVSQNVGNVNINPYLTKIGLDFEEIDNEYNAYQNLYRNVNRLEVDEDQVNKALEGYKIGDNVTQNRFALQEVKSKAQRFRNDYNSNRSVIGAARNAYAARAAAEADLMAAVEKGEKDGGINIETARALLNEYDEQYKENNGILGLNADKTPKQEVTDNIFQTYNYGKYAAYVSPDKLMNEALQGINYQGKSYAVADTNVVYMNGNSFIKARSSNGNEEYIPYAEVEDMLKTTLKENPFYQDWIKQDAMLKSRKADGNYVGQLMIESASDEARLIAQRAGLSLNAQGIPLGTNGQPIGAYDGEGNFVLVDRANPYGGNSTESLDKNEAAQRYLNALNKITTVEQLAASGQLDELSREEKEALFVDMNVANAVRKGTNKTAFSRTDKDVNESLSYVNFARGALDALELEEKTKVEEKSHVFANGETLNAPELPDFTKEGTEKGGIWDNITSMVSNTFTPDSDLMDNIQEDLKTKEGITVVNRASSMGGSAVTLADGRYYHFTDKNGISIDKNDPRIKEYISEYNREARKLGGEKVQQATYEAAAKSATNEWERAKAYRLSPEFQKFYGDDKDEFITSLDSRSDLSAKQKAEAFTTYYKGIKTKMDNELVHGRVLKGDNLEKANTLYLGTSLNGLIAGDKFRISNSPNMEAQSLAQVAEHANYSLGNDEDKAEFQKNIRVIETTGGDGGGKSGYIIAVTPKADNWGNVGEPFIIQSNYDNNQRDAVNANLYESTSVLRTPNKSESNVMYAQDPKTGSKVAFYSKRVPIYEATVMEERFNAQTNKVEKVPRTIRFDKGEKMPVKGEMVGGEMVNGKMVGGTKIEDVQVKEFALAYVKLAEITDKNSLAQAISLMTDPSQKAAKKKLEEKAFEEGLFTIGKNGELQQAGSDPRNNATDMREDTKMKDNYQNKGASNTFNDGTMKTPKWTGGSNAYTTLSNLLK